MYGSVDFLVAQEIIHMIGRKQAEQEVRELVQPERMSLVARLVNRLPHWSTDQSFALEKPHDKTFFNNTLCE